MMAFEIPQFAPALPEITAFCLGTLVLLIHAFLGEKRSSVTYYLVQLAIIISAMVTFKFVGTKTVVTFSQTFILDKFAVLLKLFLFLTTFVCFVYSRLYVKDTGMPRGEYYILGFFSLIGMMVLASANHFISLFLGLELMSLPVYAMVALRRDHTVSSEAAIKYFIIGAIASGMLLYGLSMFYGATGTMIIPEVAKAVTNTPVQQQLILLFGLVFVMVGIAFKFGAVPFHMWLPDVYEGAPTSVTMFIATAMKIAALALAVRLLAGAMPSLKLQWQQILIAIAILSMGIGNFAAIAQTNIKRMLAYSSIAHMGYMTLGLLCGTSVGYSASTFYMVTYAVTTLAAFGLLTMLSNAGFEMEKISDFKGLNSRNPWLALMMMIVMFSMAGIPPIIGFFAKLAVLEALIEVHLVWLAAVALLFAIVGAYYYIRVVKVMYFEEPDNTAVISYPMDMQAAISVNGLAVLALGLAPSALFDLCRAAF